MRFFKVKEAEALIPELEEIFANALQVRDQAEAKAVELRELERASDAGKRVSELAIKKSQVQYLVNRVNVWLRRITDLGAVPRGLDPALVDFPFKLGKKEVYLCWKRGEKKISHYHGPEDGFAGRKPLPRKAR